MPSACSEWNNHSLVGNPGREPQAFKLVVCRPDAGWFSPITSQPGAASGRELAVRPESGDLELGLCLDHWGNRDWVVGDPGSVDLPASGGLEPDWAPGRWGNRDPVEDWSGHSQTTP